MKVLMTDIDGCLNSAASAELLLCIPEARRSKNESFLQQFGSYQVQGRPWPRLPSEFCPLAVSNYNYILQKVPDLKVVVSSFWRWGKTVDELRDIFTWLGLPADRVIDKTPVLHGVHRGAEILKWLEGHPEVTKYAIIDDDSDMDGTDEKAFFHCDSYNGLVYTQSMEIIKYFNADLRLRKTGK